MRDQPKMIGGQTGQGKGEMPVRLGVDFGTTNSGAAVMHGNHVRLLPIDPQSADPTVMRSILYITRDHQIHVGRAALNAYYEQNVGRPSRMVRQWVGEIEVTAAEIPTHIRDVYILVDELTPGRLLRSLKSSLATPYEGTTIFGRYYSLEELIAAYLRAIRERAEEELDVEIASVVLGRPVNFVGATETEMPNSDETAAARNARAKARLRQAAHMAGFRDVSFELEPIAAAAHYGSTLSEPQTIIVFDFGGGTLDITVIRVDSKGTGQVFASGGVGIAGDVFDRRIIEGVLLEHFGRGSTVGPEHEPFPEAYTDALTNWQTILSLNRPETLRYLRWAQVSGSHPARMQAFESLLINNYITLLFDGVEKTKIELSDRYLSSILLRGEGLHIWQPLTRSQFELQIRDEAQRIEACLFDTLGRSGLRAHQIDAAVRTGGSAQIPLFVDMLERIFGPEKVVLSDVFGSVTAGLAIRARQAGRHLDPGNVGRTRS
jgi:hypothetical chaperone protein